MWEKLKPWVTDDTTFYASFFVLVALVSFGLGRLSIAPAPEVSNPAAVTVSQGSEPANMSTAVESQSASDTSTTYYVASQNGSKYHLPWCPSAQQITSENLVKFNSEEAARAAGYTAAANCPGL